MNLVPSQIDGIMLDAGGVLLLPDPAALRKGLAPLGLAPADEACHRAHYAGMGEVDRRRSADWPAVDRVVAQTVGVPPELIPEAIPAIQAIYAEAPWQPVPGTADALRGFQAAGIALAVVSNATGTIEAQLAAHQICATDGRSGAEVRVVVDSHQVGVEKPDPAIFGFALEALGLDPSRCLHVGDSVHFDVEGARAAGIHPVHLDPFGLCVEPDHPHVPSLHELARQLGVVSEPGNGAVGSCA